MPRVAEQRNVAPTPRWVASVPGSGTQQNGLAGHHVEPGQGCAPRNPLTRAYTWIQDFLSRKFSTASPDSPRAARAEFSRLLTRLSAGNAPGEQLAESFGQLARRWQADGVPARGTDANGQQPASAFETGVRKLLDDDWPAQRVLKLADALRQPAIRDTVEQLGEQQGTANAAMEKLREIVDQVATERATATIDKYLSRALKTLRSAPAAQRLQCFGDAAGSHPEVDAQLRKVLSVVSQLQDHKVLPERLEDVSTARITRNRQTLALLSERLQHLQASAQDIEDLLRLLSHDTLLTLHSLRPDSTDLAAQVERCFRQSSQNEIERSAGFIHEAMTNACQAITGKRLPSLITQQADAAMKRGYEALEKIFIPAQDRNPGGRPLYRGEIASVLQRALATAADESQLPVLLQHLSAQSLAWLNHANPVDHANPGHPGVAAAVRQEIEERPGRILRKLEEEIEHGPVTRTPGKGNDLIEVLGSGMQRVNTLQRQFLAHYEANELPIPPQIADDFTQRRKKFEDRLLALSDNFQNFRGDHGEQLTLARDLAPALLQEKHAKTLRIKIAERVAGLRKHVSNLLSALLSDMQSKAQSGRAASYLEVCAAAAEILRRYLVASTPTAQRTPQRFMAEVKKLIEEQPEFREAAGQLAGVVRGPEMQALVDVLAEAAVRAESAELPELQARLSDIVMVLESVAAAVNEHAATGSQAPKLSPSTLGDALDANVRERLARDFSIVVAPSGDISLSKGRCDEQFTEAIRAEIEKPISDDEQTMKTLPDGRTIPEQFQKDATRDGTDYRLPDGEPLIDKDGWDTLSDDERNARAADGFDKLVQLCQGNLHQATILGQLGNQRLGSAMLIGGLMHAPDHSPYRLQGFDGWTLSSLSSSHADVVQFEIGANQVPRIKYSYAMLGGKFVAREGADEDESVYLDRDKSRATVEMTVEVNDTCDGLRLVDRPVYDNQIVRSEINRPYRYPRVADLIQGDSSLYSDFGEFLRQADDRSDYHQLRALQVITAERRAPGSLDRLDMLYQLYLKPGALLPVVPPVAEQYADEVHELHRQMHEHLKSAPGQPMPPALRAKSHELMGTMMLPLLKMAARELPRFTEYLVRNAAAVAAPSQGGSSGQQM